MVPSMPMSDKSTKDFCLSPRKIEYNLFKDFIVLLIASSNKCGNISKNGKYLTLYYDFLFQCYSAKCLETAGPPGPPGHRGQKVSLKISNESQKNKRFLTEIFTIN